MKASLASMAVLVSALVAGCSTQGLSSGSGALSHIHGITVNPADSELYAGTHDGVYRIPKSGDVALVSETTSDFMGFTLVGSDHFLGSGHPAPDDTSKPSALGLIESTDGGQTWSTLSLEGAADFHSLKLVNGTVFGVSSTSGMLMVSNDRKTWTSLGQLAAYDIAVSPQNTQTMLATTASGLARSRDGGKTFGLVGSATPDLVLLSWPDAGPIIGVDNESSVYVSRDDGQTWQMQDELKDRPQALFASSDGQVYVATDHTIFRRESGSEGFEVFRKL